MDNQINFKINEITVQISGLVSKIIQVPTNQTVAQIYHQLTIQNSQNVQLLINNAIPPSPTAMIGDIYQVFKKNDGKVHLSIHKKF
jgi:hypothetical protein